jgi:folate-dependent phosphoribosylglycinamide formyltransferase PurN
MTVTPLGFAGRRARGAIFMSGTGVNAETILQRVAEAPAPPWIPACIVTDRPAKSRSAELAERFELPLVSHDVRSFYRDHGLKSTSLATSEGRRVRELWTDALREKLVEYAPDFGVLAGFLALTNITDDFPCLNVHPGDLTYLVDGERHLVGHHTIPIERAFLAGLRQLRSSVIIAEPYESSDDMDSGPILGVSGPVAVELGAHSVEQIAQLVAARPEKRPRGGWGDAVSDLADAHLSRLKTHGDLVVFPQVIDAFVAGCYGLDEQNELCWRDTPESPWQSIRTVEFSLTGTPVPWTR